MRACEGSNACVVWLQPQPSSPNPTPPILLPQPHPANPPAPFLAQAPALRSWWGSGPSVVGAIDSFAPRERPVGRPLRMPVTDVFKSKTGGLTERLRGYEIQIMHGGRMVAQVVLPSFPR